MQPARSIPAQTPPERPAATLSPLAEAIIAAVGEHYKIGNGGQPGAADRTRRIMLAAFADIGISPAQLMGLARVIQS